MKRSLEPLCLNEDQVVRLEGTNRALARAFVGWQCRLRQISFRQNEGRPSVGMTPLIHAVSEDKPVGRFVTVLNKAKAESSVMEFRHLYRRTRDPAQRRKDITEFLAEAYFQKPETFTDRLTTVFPPRSRTAVFLGSVDACRLVFDQFNQRYELICETIRLRGDDALFQATFWHNALFNSNLSKECEILALVPDWSRCSVSPTGGRRAQDALGSLL